jgi:hypothetical protein
VEQMDKDDSRRPDRHGQPVNHRLLGPMLLFKKIFSLKKLANKWRFLTQNIAKLCKSFIVTLVVEKNANFFAENFGQKLSKIAGNCDHNNHRLLINAKNILYFFPPSDSNRDRCYDFKNIFAKKFGEKNGRFFAQTPASFCKN